MKLSLDGAWKFQVDGSWYRELGERWQAAEEPGMGEESGWSRTGFDDRAWRKVQVPGCWDLYQKELHGYEGIGWYRRSFGCKAPPAGYRSFLHFEGVNRSAKVWLNGKLAGSHEGGYTDWELEVTDKVRPGRNLCAVKVDNRPLPGSVPGWTKAGKRCDWNTYGGLYRGVSLVVRPAGYIEDLFVSTLDTPLPGEEAVLRIEALLNGFAFPHQGLTLEVACGGKRAEVDCSRSAKTGFEWKLEKAPRWSPQTPRLMALDVRLKKGGRVLDRKSVRFGVRTVRADKGRILLNGKPLWLKGVNRQEEAGQGMTQTLAGMKRDLELCRKAGCNLIRLSHAPNDRRLYDLADEMGLLVFAEVPFYGKRSKETITNPGAIASAARQMDEMIRRDRNHPSVLAWSVGNECATDLEEARPAIRAIASAARQADPSRPVAYVGYHHLRERCFDLVDIIGLNLYQHWWGWPMAQSVEELRKRAPQARADIRKIVSGLRKRYPGKPVLVTEFGAESFPGVHHPLRGGEEFQAECLKLAWEAFRSTPGVVGAVEWSLADYMDNPGNAGQYLNFPFNLFGLVTLDRKPKLAYRMFSSLK